MLPTVRKGACRCEATIRGTSTMFSYVTPEERVRADHPLRPIRRMTDAALARLSPRFDRLVFDDGRPSIPPEQLLRALLLQILYSIRSERLLMEELDYSVLYRWFVGPEHGRPGLGCHDLYEESRSAAEGDIADAFFAEVLAAIRAEGLLSDEHFTVDGTLLEAWASHKSFKPEEDAGRAAGRSEESDGQFSRAAAPQRHASIDDGSRGAAVQEGRRPRSQTGLSRASADRESPRLHRRHGGHRAMGTAERDAAIADARRIAADDAARDRRRRQELRHARLGRRRPRRWASRRTSPNTRRTAAVPSTDGPRAILAMRSANAAGRRSSSPSAG